MEYAKLAAEQAQALSAPRAAVEQWTRVMQAAGQLGQAVPPTCYRARGQAYEILGDFEQAKADYRTGAARRASDAGGTPRVAEYPGPGLSVDGPRLQAGRSVFSASGGPGQTAG